MDFSEFQGEWYFPYWTFRVQGRVTYDQWRLIWTANYIDGQKSEPAFIDDWDDISGSSNTCLGPPDDVLCRDIEWTSDYMTHALTLVYQQQGGGWSVRAGVRNLFDEEPPFINEGPANYSNVPLGAGYSLDGRVYFLNLYASLDAFGIF